jgi:hypothetical protein
MPSRSVEVDGSVLDARKQAPETLGRDPVGGDLYRGAPKALKARAPETPKPARITLSVGAG